MQSTSEGCLNIAELANQLRREKIFINSERQLLQTLNEEVEKNVLELLQVAWICSQQRQNLNSLITSRCEADSVAACQRASLLEATTFIDAHKVFKFKEAQALGELLGWLRDSPHLVALCLLLGEEHLPPNFTTSLVAGLYGSARSAVDRTQLLAVIRSLIKHQLATGPDPRKLFRSGRCALAQLYSVFKDGHAPARQFLIAVLQGPVMAVLQEDEFFLDIDPEKAMERFSASDRIKKFGQPNSPEHNSKMSRYRKWTIQSLYNLTNKFIVSMKENWIGFPSMLAWIIQQIVHILKNHARTPDRDLHGLCSDLVMNNFICPAIVNPEAYGVVDVPVSYIARFNLIQIAQIIQMLCLAKHQEVDPKLRDIYAKFDRSCVSSLVEAVCSNRFAPELSATEHSPLRTEPPSTAPVALYTREHLTVLLSYLKRISSKLNNNTPSVTSEETSSGSGPIAEPNAPGSEAGSEGSSTSLEGCASSLAGLLQSIEPNYKSRLHDLLKKMPDVTKYKQTPPEPKESESQSKRSILAKVPKPRLPRSSSSNNTANLEDKHSNGDSGDKEYPPEVLIIKLASVDDQDYVGLVGEQKVLECYYGGDEGDHPSPLAVSLPPAPVTKRTRFSVSHDEVSLGNTSDNLEAVSEAASNHSVTSSLELETEDQNDNLSDMVSANVSGRGSPNISGRETPSSQVTDGDAPGDLPPRRQQQNIPVSQAANVQAKMLKQTRNDIEDKFCKFEIRKLVEGDETISIMSDTWSTDVLASDSETIGDSCENTQIQATIGTSSSTIAPDVSETASESAWSMDVLASDSDRNTEVDTDDCVSVAARSDSSWPRRPSALDESMPRQHHHHNTKRPDTSSPRHTSRPQPPNRSGGGYLCATAQLSLGAELDLSCHPRSPNRAYAAENRKSILVNGYPVMTGFAASAPESPSTAPAPLNNDVFDYPNNNQEEGDSARSAGESTVEGDATSQWVVESFPPSPPNYHHHYSPGFGAEPEPDRAEPESRGSITELMSRMSSATISSSANLVNNITSRIVSKEIRTSIVSISSSRVERREATPGGSAMSASCQEVDDPPPRSTGAIPKSISFDASAEKAQRRRIVGEDGLVGNLDELKNNVKRSGGNLLHKIKMFRHKGRTGLHSNDIKLPEDSSRPEDVVKMENGESSEEILAKYRRKGSGDGRRGSRGKDIEHDHEIDRCEGVVDLNDPEAFNSMKRRLRLVLSNADLYCPEFVPNQVNASSVCEYVRAMSGATYSGVESAAWSGVGGSRVAAALRADLAARRPYAAYLASCRAGLTHARAIITRQIQQVRGECVWCVRATGAARTVDLLERGALLRGLPGGATQHVSELMDEKASRLTATIKSITAEVKADPSWEGACQSILESAELTVERAAFARIYLQILFPNGDGDISRDQMFSEHIRRLSLSVGPCGVGVSPRHVWAAPFPRAHSHLTHLPVYHTPRDKISCIMRCVACVMSCLALSEGGPPAADDLTPVLVYVIIRVNPPSLLSTIELVNALGGNALQGEALYWWTHFCAAVAYIKTMDYPRQSDS